MNGNKIKENEAFDTIKKIKKIFDRRKHQHLRKILLEERSEISGIKFCFNCNEVICQLLSNILQ